MPETSETIRLSGEFSWRDAQHVGRLVIPLRQRLLVHTVAVLLIYSVISVFRPTHPIGLIAFSILVVVYFGMLSRLQRRRFLERQANRGNARVDIDSGGVILRGTDQATRFAWSAFGSVTRDDRFIVLRGIEPGRLPMIILPRSWCSTDAQWTRVEELVAGHLSPTVVAYTTEGARQFRGKQLPTEYALKRSTLLLLCMTLVISLAVFVAPFDVTTRPGAWYVFMFRWQMILLSAVCGLTAWGVLRLAAWSRIPLQGLAFLCIPLFPLGTVLGARILRLLTTGPTPHLLTKDYEGIVRIAGPMNSRKSRRVRAFTWIVLALIVLIVILAGVISLIPKEIRHNL